MSSKYFSFYETRHHRSVDHLDVLDAMTMAIHYMKESWHLTHPDDPELEDAVATKKKTYWSF